MRRRRQVEFGSEWCAATVAVDAPAGTATVVIRGELDVASEDLLGHVLDAACQSGCPSVVIDLAELDFLDLRSLGTLLARREQLRGQGRALGLRNPNRLVQTLLRAAGVDRDLVLGSSHRTRVET
jgi:anti-anti-sigma factor